MKNDIEKLANLITDALLTNGFDQVGDRLAIKQLVGRTVSGPDVEHDLGGRCRESIVEEIKRTIEKSVLNVYLQPNLTH